MTTVVSLLDLLAVPGLRLRLVAGDPAVLAGPVRWVHSTELPEPGRYLRGGELVCTVGVSLTGAAACDAFVASVAGARAAGICFGTGDVHPTIPAALVAACARHALPLLELPAGAPFLAVGEHLADQWVRAGSVSSAHGERLTARLLGALEAGAGVPELLAIGDEATAGHLELRAGAAGPVRWSGAGDPPSADLLAQLGRVLDVAVHEAQVARRAHLAHVGHLLRLVGDGLADPRALLPELEAAGLSGCPLLVVSAWRGGCDHVAAADVVLGLTGDVVLAVGAPGPAPDGAPGVRGLSSPVPLAGLAGAVGQATSALDVATRTGAPAGPGDLTTLDALLEQAPAAALEPFVAQLVRPLVESDRRHGTAQLETLRVFLLCDGSPQRTARRQFLHVNTVRHRLDRVREVTGRDPFRFADRVAFAVALFAVDHERVVG